MGYIDKFEYMTLEDQRDYRAQQAADDEEAYQASLAHEAWCLKVKNYFEWRANLTPSEHGDLDQYYEEDWERKLRYGITLSDEIRWDLQKQQTELPF